MASIKNNINQIREKIDFCAKKSNRDPQEITLIAVTKTMPVYAMKEAVDCQIIDLGENKVQEIQNKFDSFGPEIKWHLIGHLQTNKVKYIIDKVIMIHSVDSQRLAFKINEEAKKYGKVQDILIQVNIAMEDTKFGIGAEDVELFIREIAPYSNIRIRGLMTVAPFVENPEDNRVVFKKMKQIIVDINLKNIDNVHMDALSMGMTNDYEIAIEEGATLVRVGTAIFGHRNYL